ncbi:hypothetical protein PHYPSEUDO_003659 [Phytophthora pseudosyringae]|uniref:ABC transporter domain-containing protein n=1 Tax=Phytophthora pseudosyringae TaxID=221518 RepID=A0A8T1VTK5_9STRA|nr:hypothetical protein PHYPSEUDO_003659 [Phytophthora pseudosyringae]
MVTFSYVGMKGEQLSGGQKQRIAISTRHPEEPGDLASGRGRGCAGLGEREAGAGGSGQGGGAEVIIIAYHVRTREGFGWCFNYYFLVQRFPSVIPVPECRGRRMISSPLTLFSPPVVSPPVFGQSAMQFPPGHLRRQTPPPFNRTATMSF